MGEEEYNSAMATYSDWGVFFKAVADKLGHEKAMELHEDAVTTLAMGYEAMLKENFPDGVDLKPFGEGTVEGLTARGWTAELHMDGKDKATMKMTRCPRYEGFKMAGLSDEVIKEHCMRQVRILERYAQKADPRIRFDVGVWDAPNGRCDEVFTLKK
jgi:hypothetical protein